MLDCLPAAQTAPSPVKGGSIAASGLGNQQPWLAIQIACDRRSGRIYRAITVLEPAIQPDLNHPGSIQPLPATTTRYKVRPAIVRPNSHLRYASCSRHYFRPGLGGLLSRPRSQAGSKAAVPRATGYMFATAEHLHWGRRNIRLCRRNGPCILLHTLVAGAQITLLRPTGWQ